MREIKPAVKQGEEIRQYAFSILVEDNRWLSLITLNYLITQAVFWQSQYEGQPGYGPIEEPIP